MAKFKDTVEIIPLAGLKLHEITNLHPVQTEEEYMAMKHSIEEQGQLVPVYTYRGKVVDGRHRVKAMKELGLKEIKATALNPVLTLTDLKRKVVASDLRRSKTAAQKAIQAWQACNDDSNVSREEAALLYSTNITNISIVNTIAKQVGTTALDKLLAAGKLTLTTVDGSRTYTDLRKLKQATKPITIAESDKPTSYVANEEVKIILSSIDELDTLDVQAVLGYCKKRILADMEM